MFPVLAVAWLGCSAGGAASSDAGSDAPVDASGSDAPADGSSSTLVLPDCLRALLATCPLEGACEGTPRDGGATLFGITFDNLCYASGARVVFSAGSTGVPASVAQVSAAGGTACYRLEYKQGPFGESTNLTWFDSAGRPVAQANYEFTAGAHGPSSSIYCLDDVGHSVGETSRCYSTQPRACEVPLFLDCVAGSCP
jgi:hypothetical protein